MHNINKDEEEILINRSNSSQWPPASKGTKEGYIEKIFILIVLYVNEDLGLTNR